MLISTAEGMKLKSQELFYPSPSFKYLAKPHRSIENINTKEQAPKITDSHKQGERKDHLHFFQSAPANSLPNHTEFYEICPSVL